MRTQQNRKEGIYRIFFSDLPLTSTQWQYLQALSPSTQLSNSQSLDEATQAEQQLKLCLNKTGWL